MKVLIFLLIIFVTACISAAVICFLRTLLMPTRKSDYRPEFTERGMEKERAEQYARKLSAMVCYDTTSYPFSDQHPEQLQVERFLGYHKVLEELFPLVHRHLEKVEISGSLLYCWKGRASDQPIVLMGHQDVVPVEGASWGSVPGYKASEGETDQTREDKTPPYIPAETALRPKPDQAEPVQEDGDEKTNVSDNSEQSAPGSDGGWIRPPFSGEIADGRVWGRGSVDTKCSCMAFFQAVEELLREGFVPAQDVYLSSSCTEEWGGPGCQAIIDELGRRGVRPWLVCDEGGGIYTDPMPGIRGNFAMIGVGEKGRANVRFVARGKGGHASTPQKNSPIARLAAFVCDVEKHSPFRSSMEPPTRAMLEALAPSASFPIRLILQNLWLFRRPIELVTPRINGQAAAMLGTTITFTMASGSDAVNVFPQEATLGANMRFVHHQDMKESLEIISRIASRYGLETEVVQGAACTGKVDFKGRAFRYIEETVEKTFPGCVTSPYILTAATDAAFYDAVCDNCIRFAPVIYGPEEKKGIHGVNEALPYDCLPGAVDFFKNLVIGLEGQEELSRMPGT